MLESANSFCHNCEQPLSKHNPRYDFPVGVKLEYSCPTGDGVNFFDAVMYVPMTNLEFLERMAHNETLCR